MTSQAVTALASLGAGSCGGFLAGLFGVGGGIVLIPLLGLALGLNQHQAQGATLAAMLLPNGLPAVLHMRSRGIRTSWTLVGLLTAGFIPAVWGGARLANLIPDGPLRWGFSLFLLAVAARALLQGRSSQSGPAREQPAPLGEALAGLAIGAVGGLASGLLGIGGGIVMIPLMVWLLRLSQHEAQAASLTLMLAPIGLPGVIVYARSGGGLPWLIMAGVAIGFMAGAYGGARLATRILGPRLRKAFAVFMAIMAVLLVLRDF
jgi:uncharacterized membrane protein YfcA